MRENFLQLRLCVFDGVGLVSLKRMEYILRKPKQSHEKPFIQNPSASRAIDHRSATTGQMAEVRCHALATQESGPVAIHSNW
jgi:hypothetical protein